MEEIVSPKNNTDRFLHNFLQIKMVKLLSQIASSYQQQMQLKMIDRLKRVLLKNQICYISTLLG